VASTCEKQQLGEGHVTLSSERWKAQIERLLVELANGPELCLVPCVDLIQESLDAPVPAVAMGTLLARAAR
jgi:hypothetical protein